MNPQLDLSQLAIQRVPSTKSVDVRRRRHLLTRWILPGLLLAGFAALITYAARETFSPPRVVTVIPVTLSQQALDAPVDTPLFRAAGWVEPRPMPTVVTALAEGVVEQLLVLEGQEVKRGQVVARLIAEDARLALEAAEAEVELREGELAAAKASYTAAKERFELPVHLQAELAEAETALARAESDLAALPSQLATAEARQAFARRDYEGARRSGTAVPTITVEKARTELDTAAGTLRELQTREKRLPIEITALTARRDALKLKLQRKVDERRQLGEAEAAVKSAEARLRQARASRDLAQLRLQRMEIRSPINGRVLALVARPGTRLNGMTTSSLQDSSTVLTLYDPSSLQVRVDVRLDDVAKVQPGQKLRIETAALPDTPLQGEVLLATSQADIQKNTLSVKVAIHDPPLTLKPEMLCQVTFLAPPRRPGSTSSDTQRLLVPRQLLDNGGLWVVDPLSGTARWRSVELGFTAGELIEVVRGLASTDKLIVAGREGLREGTRVQVRGEDETLGLTPTTATPRR